MSNELRKTMTNDVYRLPVGMIVYVTRDLTQGVNAVLALAMTSSGDVLETLNDFL